MKRPLSDLPDRLQQLPALTSLRFLAAMAVVLFHVPYVLPASVGLKPLEQGALGVSFFFVLSGFILRHAQAPQGFDTLAFYRRRAARVLPLHYLTLLTWTWLFFDSWGNSLTEKINSGVANLLAIHALFSGHLFTLGYNAVSWSISAELVFYALFPLLLGGRRAVWLFAILAIGMLLLPQDAAAGLERAFQGFFYFHPAARLLEFSAGMALHALWRRFNPGEGMATRIQLGGLLALLALVPASAGWPVHLRNLALLLPFGLLILGFAYGGPLTRLLSHPLPVLLGEASFALYMTHHMLFRLLDPHLVALGPAAALAVASAAAILLSILVLRLFEQPVRRLLNRAPMPSHSRRMAATPVPQGGVGG
ncbi:acyltransferase family protein [Falsiroseomonas tokyonensis]|uniref:Acyltransferase family protein n=1 Tax=Falsiroseomonas tokyonensis TaxID=430521 RepID=A0ABV7BSS2_9PROT|nr:acyltransferase [Falsiroseomonas tokyonensis]MBU8537160.1 acyltransferase [Falsiroseomonas tokyonensis]